MRLSVPLKDGRTVSLRGACAADAVGALHFRRDLLTEARRQIMTEPQELTDDETSQAEWITSRCWDLGDQMWLAFDDQQIVGTLSCSAARKKKICHVATLGMAVASTHRRCGIGRALMQACIDQAESNPHVRTLRMLRSTTCAAARSRCGSGLTRSP